MSEITRLYYTDSTLRGFTAVTRALLGRGWRWST